LSLQKTNRQWLAWALTPMLLIALVCIPLAYGDAAVNDGNGDDIEASNPQDDGDTEVIETETTVDIIDDDTSVSLSGDFRSLFDYIEIDQRNGNSIYEGLVGFRGRLRGVVSFADELHVGARLSAICFSDGNCDPDFVMDSATPSSNGLNGGQITFDEMYVLWARQNSAAIALGRLQTRFVLRGGVFAKSLDRNDSNNVNVTWTDGVQITSREYRGWSSSFVWQRNASDGTGSIRRGPLDYDNRNARNTYFIGFENLQPSGFIVQRAFDISYLPSALLEDGDPKGDRDDYVAFVGRLVARWPQRQEGIRLRGGFEVGYVPNTASREVTRIGDSVSGFAWNGVLSLIDFQPGHSIGINYARTGAGWYLSPQYRPNEEQFEIRYAMKLKNWPVFESRIRWREDIDQRVNGAHKRDVLDMNFRLTWKFGTR
jgi:hypothetical protein